MKIKLKILFFTTVLFAGCNSSDNSSSGSSSTTSSQTVSAATVNSTSAAEVFSNFQLDLNPIIVISGNSATYTNSDNSQGFEIATLNDVKVYYKDGTDGALEIKFEHDSFIDGNITITLSGFVDRGNEGYIDEFTVEKAEVKKSDGTTKEISSVANTKKTNLGTNLKRSASDMTENNITVPDFSGSPTVDEWNRYMLGTAILANDTSTVGELTLVQFTSSSAGRYIDDDGDSGTFTYVYSQVDDTKGKLDISLTWTDDDGTMVEEFDPKDLTFTDFYNGTWQDTGAGTEKNLTTGAITQETPPLSGGPFNTITDVEIYLSDNKITVSTN